MLTETLGLWVFRVSKTVSLTQAFKKDAERELLLKALRTSFGRPEHFPPLELFHYLRPFGLERIRLWNF